MTSRLERQQLGETTWAQPSLTWNFRGGPSGWIRALATSATTMPRRRTAGKLLSRRHFTPAIRLASNSGKTNAYMLHVPWGGGNGDRVPVPPAHRPGCPGAQRPPGVPSRLRQLC